MAKEAVFTMKLEPELRDAFMAAAQSVATVRRRRSYASSCATMSQQDQELSLSSSGGKSRSRAHQIAAGRVSTNEEVEAEMDELVRQT